MKRLRTWLGLIVIATISCNGGGPEDFTERATTASLLMGVFPSYSNAVGIQQSYLAGADWNVIENSQTHPRDPRIRFDILRVSSAGYVHLGHRGEVELEFFNDRLLSVWFYPDEPESYLKALAADGLQVRYSQPGMIDDVKVPPYTRVWATRDHRGKVYIGWAVSRLEEQRFRWISQYA